MTAIFMETSSIIGGYQKRNRITHPYLQMVPIIVEVANMVHFRLIHIISVLLDGPKGLDGPCWNGKKVACILMVHP